MQTLKAIWDFFQSQLLGMKWLNDLISRGLNLLGFDTPAPWDLATSAFTMLSTSQFPPQQHEVTSFLFFFPNNAIMNLSFLYFLTFYDT
jgi:hypothetical protein